MDNSHQCDVHFCCGDFCSNSIFIFIFIFNPRNKMFLDVSKQGLRITFDVFLGTRWSPFNAKIAHWFPVRNAERRIVLLYCGVYGNIKWAFNFPFKIRQCLLSLFGLFQISICLQTYRDFHADIFPDTAIASPAIAVSDWMAKKPAKVWKLSDKYSFGRFSRCVCG